MTQASNVQTLEVELPSGVTATIREFTGREEDLLTDEKVLKSGKLHNRLLGNLLLTLNGSKPSTQDILNLYSADRFAVLLHARVLSFGADFETEHECADRDCKHHFKVSAQLPDDLEYQAFQGAEVTVELPNGEVATMRPLKGTDEDTLLQARQRGQLMTELLFRRTLSITGVEDRQALRTYLLDGPSRVRSALRGSLRDSDFGFAQYLTVSCPVCQAEQQVDLATSRDFFFPGETNSEA